MNGSEKPRCSATYYPPSDPWHQHRCEHPAKWTALVKGWGETATRRPVCGVHARRYGPDRLEPIA